MDKLILSETISETVSYKKVEYQVQYAVDGKVHRVTVQQDALASLINDIVENGHLVLMVVLKY